MALSIWALAAMALAAAGCGGESEPAVPDAWSAPDAAEVGQTPDDGGVSSPFWLVTCEGEAPAPDYADAGETEAVDAGETEAADAGADPLVGVDEPCCDPEGACPGDLACIRGPAADQYRCRPPCAADGACPSGSVCADFGGQPICIPASTIGLPCAPELCDATSICVGHSADDALCYQRCAEAADCPDGLACVPLEQSTAKACLPSSY